MMGYIRRTMACRLCWTVTFAVFAAIFIVEGIILVPSYRNYERDLLLRQELIGKATVHSIYNLAGSGAGLTNILNYAKMQLGRSVLKGGAFYGPDGRRLGTIGEVPQSAAGGDRYRSPDGSRYEIYWTGGELGGPYAFQARLDTSMLSDELTAFVGRIFGLVLLIAFFVTGVTMFILDRTVLKPLLALREKTLQAGKDPEQPHNYTLQSERNDELGDVIRSYNGMLGMIASNIKDLKEREEELSLSNQLTEKASRSKIAFLVNMSHELRTPLNAIIGFSEMMKDETFGSLGSDKYREYSNDIHKSGSHLLNLINQILDLSKAEAGKLELFEEDLDVGDVIRQSMNMVRGRSAKAGVRTASEIDPGLPLLCADSMRLKQIMLNLLSNAIKYTPPGGTIRVQAGLNADGDMRIIVSDTGSGIPREDIPKVMELYGQADITLTRDKEGTGLGLPLTKRFVEMHGGVFELNSEPGVGTDACVIFPTERVLTGIGQAVAASVGTAE